MEGQLMNLKTTMIAAPSELYAMFDSAYFWADISKTDGAGSVPFPRPVQGDYGLDCIRYAHNLGLNMLYADGHAEWMPGPLRGMGSWRPPNDPTFNYAHVWSNGRHWFARQ